MNLSCNYILRHVLLSSRFHFECPSLPIRNRSQNMLIKSDYLSKQTHLSNSLTFSSTSQKMKELTSFFVLLNLVFPFVHSHSESYADFPFDTCSIENKSCEIHSDSFIESFTVNDLEECRQLCEYSENCQ